MVTVVVIGGGNTMETANWGMQCYTMGMDLVVGSRVVAEALLIGRTNCT